MFRVTLAAGLAVLTSVLLLDDSLVGAAAAAPPINPTEAKLLSLINEQRAAEKLPPLRWDAPLAVLAREQAQRCAESGKLTAECHDYGGKLGERLQAAQRPFRAAGENLASYPTPEATVDAWMNSPPHRRNLLNPDVTEVGLGVATHEGFGVTCAIFLGLPETTPATSTVESSAVSITVDHRPPPAK